jgi:hypothetical protein
VTNINGVDPMGSMVRVTDEVDEEAEHRQAVAYELKPLRAQAEARRQFDAEKAGPAMPFDWGWPGDFKDRTKNPYRIEGSLAASGGLEAIAQRKAGKTTLILNLARSLIIGEPFLDRFVTHRVARSVGLLNYQVSSDQIDWWVTESGITEGLFTVQLRGRRNPLGISSSATTTAGSSGSRPSARTVTRSSSFHTVPL